jgi:hypothetical protein
MRAAETDSFFPEADSFSRNKPMPLIRPRVLVLGGAAVGRARADDAVDGGLQAHGRGGAARDARAPARRRA